ncbi:hypothetical protein IKP85_01235 [bacterium]|nr:hypothetical protein [bacterium]
MKKLHSIILSLMIIGACSGISYAAEFTPLNFEDATYSSESKIALGTNKQTAEPAKKSVTDVTGSQNMQGAISQLDNAQVEVRNELLNYKTKYSEIDAQYNKVKAERANLSKQIRACEKKINQLDKAKEKIRKNMI